MPLTVIASQLTGLWKVIRRYPCTTWIMVAIWLMFVVELVTHALGNQDMLLRLGALPTNGIRHREYWRLWTYALLHSGWWHIAINSYLLLMAGPPVERTLGARSTVVIGNMGAALGGAAILLAHHADKASIELGASGALFAFLGAGLVMTWQRSPAHPSRTHRYLRTILIVGLAISFIPGISMAAHLAGLAAGTIYALAVRYWRTNAYIEYGVARH